MATRYKNNETKKLNDGRVVYKSKIYPNIPLRDDDIYIVTQTGDRLDTIAYKYYKSPDLWWVVAGANNIHDVGFGLTDGTILRIPKDYTRVLNKFNK
jgi:hypothetical protein